MKEKVENFGVTTFDSDAQFSEVMGFHPRKLGGWRGIATESQDL